MLFVEAIGMMTETMKNTPALLVASACLFLTAAKAHGRELRLEREAAGVLHAVFGGQNPPIVEAIWRAERARFWIATPIVAVALSALLFARGAGAGRIALAALTWAPAISFTALGALSFVRAGGLARGDAAGSAGWWSLVAALAAATAATLAPKP
jgi:hypothetical protein